MAVIVEKAMEARADDERFQLVVQEKEAKLKKEKLCKLCAEMDDDGSGDISLEELVNNYETNRRFLTTLRGMRIEKEDIVRLFKLVDTKDKGSVAYEEFAEQVYKMKNADTTTMLHWITQYIVDVSKDVRAMKNELQKNMRQETANRCRPNAPELSEISVPPAPTHAAHLHVAGCTLAAADKESLLHRTVLHMGMPLPQAAATLQGGVPEVVIPARLELPQAEKVETGRSNKAAMKIVEKNLQAAGSEFWGADASGSLHERFLAMRQRIQEQLTCITADAVQKADMQGRALVESVELLSALEKSLPTLVNGLLVETAGKAAVGATSHIAAQLLEQPSGLAMTGSARPSQRGKVSARSDQQLLAAIPTVSRRPSCDTGDRQLGAAPAADPILYSVRKSPAGGPCCTAENMSCGH